jgi:hypothetical protein
MPSIDFAALRSTVSMVQVLELLNFNPVSRSGDELSGLRRVHGSSLPTSLRPTSHQGCVNRRRAVDRRPSHR